jgi:hypothetical protein
MARIFRNLTKKWRIKKLVHGTRHTRPSGGVDVTFTIESPQTTENASPDQLTEYLSIADKK